MNMGDLIRFIYYIYNYRLLYYLPMERMEINLSIMTKDQLKKFIVELEKENKKLRAYADNLDSENDNQAIEIEELKEENRKLKDEFMLRLAEAYLLPPTSNQMAEYKQWNYSKWYDEIKNQMRKEIKEED